MACCHRNLPACEWSCLQVKFMGMCAWQRVSNNSCSSYYCIMQHDSYGDSSLVHVGQRLYLNDGCSHRDITHLCCAKHFESLTLVPKSSFFSSIASLSSPTLNCQGPHSWSPYNKHCTKRHTAPPSGGGPMSFLWSPSAQPPGMFPQLPSPGLPPGCIPGNDIPGRVEVSLDIFSLRGIKCSRHVLVWEAPGVDAGYVGEITSCGWPGDGWMFGARFGRRYG